MQFHRLELFLELQFIPSVVHELKWRQAKGNDIEPKYIRLEDLSHQQNCCSRVNLSGFANSFHHRIIWSATRPTGVLIRELQFHRGTGVPTTVECYNLMDLVDDEWQDLGSDSRWISRWESVNQKQQTIHHQINLILCKITFHWNKETHLVPI